MTKFWVIRFAKRLVETPLFFTPVDNQLGFTPKVMEAFGFKSKEDAENCLKEILAQCKDPLMKAHLTRDLEVEAHVLGDMTQ